MIPSWIRNLGTYTTTTANSNNRCGNNVLSMTFYTTLAQRLMQDILGLTVGRQYEVTGWVRRANKVGGQCQSGYIFVTNTDYTSAITRTVTLSGEWQRIQGIWTAPTTGARIQVATVCPAGEEVYWDDITFTPVIPV